MLKYVSWKWIYQLPLVDIIYTFYLKLFEILLLLYQWPTFSFQSENLGLNLKSKHLCSVSPPLGYPWQRGVSPRGFAHGKEQSVFHMYVCDVVCDRQQCVQLLFCIHSVLVSVGTLVSGCGVSFPGPSHLRGLTAGRAGLSYTLYCRWDQPSACLIPLHSSLSPALFLHCSLPHHVHP